MFCRLTDGNSEKFGGSIAFRVRDTKMPYANGVRTSYVQREAAHTRIAFVPKRGRRRNAVKSKHFAGEVMLNGAIKRRSWSRAYNTADSFYAL